MVQQGLCSAQSSGGYTSKVHTVTSQGEFDGNISYATYFLANFRFTEFTSANHTLEAIFILFQTHLGEFVSSL